MNGKNFQLYLVILCCAATATVNIQVMVGGKNTDCFLDVCNRFFAEACVPKIFLPDKDAAILKVLNEMEVNVVDLEGTLSKEKGIYLKTVSKIIEHEINSVPIGYLHHQTLISLQF